MVDVQKFVGLSEGEARVLATQAGLNVAISNTVVPVLLTSSMQMNRITLTLNGGFVTAATLG